ncbi:MAG: hypothetical protein C5B58_15215 [Acidobacteria bacterium]|nr:MAG: hypothetical protein C5B58_15215 [Acidobacteriota bacterium]
MGSIFGFPPIVHAIAFACFFWLAALLLGRRLVNIFRLPANDFTALEANLISLTIGTGFLQLVPYLLASAHALSTITVRLTCALLYLMLLPEAGRVLVQANQSFRAALKTTTPAALKIWGAILAVTLGIFLVHALAFGSFGDDDGYHLSAPLRWLHDHTLSYLPTYTNTNASMGFEMLYVIALSFGEPVGAKLLHYSTGLWTLLAIVLCARRLGDYTAGIISISVLLISTPIVNLSYIFPLAYVDLPSCWAAMMSVLAWLAWHKHPGRQLLSVVALCAGIAISFKLTVFPLVAAWIFTIALELYIRRAAQSEILKQLIIFFVIAVLPTCLWFLRNFVVTGNPVYPLLANFIETRDWSIEQTEILSRFMHYYTWGVASGAQLSEETRRALIIVTALLVVGAAGFLAWLARDITLRLMLLFTTIYTVLSVLLTGLLFRYWIFGIACFTLVGTIVLDRLVPQVGRRQAIALTLISIAFLVQIDGERRQSQRFINDLSIALGVRSPQQVHADDPIWQLWGKIRELTPPDARILVAAFYTTFGATSFGCFPIDRQCFVTDSHAQRYIRLDTWPAFLNSVAIAGIQYVLISDQQFTATRYGFTFTAGANEYPFCSRLVEEYGEVIARSEHLLLYRLRSLGSPADEGTGQ